MTPLLRTYRPQDLGQILELWGADGEDAIDLFSKETKKYARD